MPFLQHFKEIQMLVLKEVVQYRIPVYFERPYVNFAKYAMRIEGGDIVLEFPIKEKCKTFVENAEERRKAES